MMEKTEHRDAYPFDLPEADTNELRSKQSVRATFKLSKDTISTLSVVSNQLGVKQKSLFDQLVADAEVLEKIARELSSAEPYRRRGVQKTLVISRGTLSLLQKMAETYDAPRDALVEMSIQRLKPVIAQEKAKLAQRKRIAAKVKNAVAAQRRLLTEASETLGPEDPLCDHLSCALERLESAHTAIAAFVQKSERVMALDL